MYVIINKLSDNVLDHWGGTRIEALNDDPNDPHHRWRMLPCHKRYFAIINVSTGGYLYDDGTAPNAGNSVDTQMTDEDRRCCWTFVSHRDPGIDTISIDPDLSQPYQKSHLRVARSPGGKKGKGKTKSSVDHIPVNPRIERNLHNVIRRILEHFIGQWEEDQLATNTQARQYASVDRREVEGWGIGIVVPQALVQGSDRNGWCGLC
jgi:hypothetical protein